MSEERKSEIRRRITLMRYPRRDAAKFTDENDHNPLVLQDCPKCHGVGRVCEYERQGERGRDAIYRVECPVCAGSGIAGEVERFFPDDWPEAEADADAKGWLTCPRCGWRFTIRDGNA